MNMCVIHIPRILNHNNNNNNNNISGWLDCEAETWETITHKQKEKKCIYPCDIIK